MNDWVKKTCAQRETLAISGFALDGRKWDGIYLGRRKGKELVYAGKVDHGFDSASAKDLQARLKPLIRETQPYAKKIADRGIWVEPLLMAEIEIPGEVCRGQGTPSFLQGHPGGFMSWRVALMWGTVIVAVLLGVLAAAYLLIQTFVFG